MIDSDKINENESHLRSVIEQLQTRNRAMEREARNVRAIISSLKAAMREDSEHFFAQAKEIRLHHDVARAARHVVSMARLTPEQAMSGYHDQEIHMADLMLVDAVDALEKARQD